MFGNDSVADKALQKSVMRRLQRSGSQGGLTAVVQSGRVTVAVPVWDGLPRPPSRTQAGAELRRKRLQQMTVSREAARAR